MPQIKQYENPVQGIRPTETGVEATAQAARRGSQIFKESAMAEQRLAGETNQYGREVENVGRLEGHMYQTAATDVARGLKEGGDAAVDYMAHREISHGASIFAQYDEQKTNQLQDTVLHADLNDPTVIQKFMQGLEPDFDQLRKGFWTEKGQQFAENRIEALRNSFFKSATQEMGTMAQAADRANIKNLAISHTNTVVADPTKLQGVIDHTDDEIHALVSTSSYLKGANARAFEMEMSGPLKQQYATEAIKSAILKFGDPVGTAAKLTQQFSQYVSGGDVLSLSKQAQSQQKFNLAQDKAIMLADKQLAKQSSDRVAVGILKSLDNPDGSQRVATKDDFKKLQDYGNMPGTDKADYAFMHNYMTKEEKSMGPSDPGILHDVQDRLSRGEDITMDLVKYNTAASRGEPGINDYNMGKLKQLNEMAQKDDGLRDKGVQTAIAAAEKLINIPSNASDFRLEFSRKFLELPPEQRAAAIKFSDKNSLISTVMESHDASPAEKIQYRTMGPAGLGFAVPDASGMSVTAAVKKFGPGATVNYNGVPRVLPGGPGGQ